MYFCRCKGREISPSFNFKNIKFLYAIIVISI
nr:MAG TPA: hypothetical protein [Caudoviricetes sp.]